MGTECLPWEETREGRMGYIEAHEAAQERRAAGQRQNKCFYCARWYWYPDDEDEHQAGRSVLS